MEIKKDSVQYIYCLIAQLYMHRSIKKIYDYGYEIQYPTHLYKYPTYHFKTQFKPLIAYMNLKFNKHVKNFKIGRTNYLKIVNGAEGRFCSISKYFEIGEDFMPGLCFYASKEVAEQLREKDIDFDFIVLDRSSKPEKVSRHAVIRTTLPGFKNPVIVDGSISAIIEETLYMEIQPYRILAVYHNKDLPEEMRIGFSVSKETYGQYLKIDDKQEQDKQFEML